MGDKKEVLDAYCKSLEPGGEAGISRGMGLGHPPWGGGGGRPHSLSEYLDTASHDGASLGLSYEAKALNPKPQTLNICLKAWLAPYTGRSQSHSTHD